MATERRSGRRNGLIFIVDDEVSLCGFMSACLITGGFRVAVAHHEIGIVERVALVKPLVIVLDLEMPGLDEQAVLIALKLEPRTRHIPVVMFSGCSVLGWQELATRSGCDSCLEKPASSELLLEAVRGALGPGYVNTLAPTHDLPT